jgi:putative ABC transport system ATP-binding protein
LQNSFAQLEVTMTEVLLEAKALGKRYAFGETFVDALANVDFSLQTGELVVVLGPSGSGKSTFLNILGTLDRPTVGTLNYKNELMTEKTDEELCAFRREKVGLVFQFYNLIPSLTALENVQLIESHGESAMSSEDALRRLNLWERRNHFPSELSGGEQQRVAIARAIVKKPALLLCDEPTGALDVSTGVVVLQAIEEVHHDFGVSVMLITHNVMIAGIADRVIHMSGGKITSIEKNLKHMLARDLQW